MKFHLYTTFSLTWSLSEMYDYISLSFPVQLVIGTLQCDASKSITLYSTYCFYVCLGASA